MNGELRPVNPLPNMAVCLARGLVHPPAPPQPRNRERTIDIWYEKHLALVRDERQANIAAGLTAEGKPRKRPWNRIIAASKEEHDAIRRERNKLCTRRRRAGQKSISAPGQANSL